MMLIVAINKMIDIIATKKIICILLFTFHHQGPLLLLALPQGAHSSHF